jgi:DNA-binding PadR family transcriptional regulator
MFGRHHRHRGHFESMGDMGEHEGRGGRGPRRRMFEAGHLRLVILDLVGEMPRHGYDVIKALEARCGGLYSPSPGVVYPTLSLLEDQGFVTMEESEGNKKRYTVTAEGRAHLAENWVFIDAINARLSGGAAHRGKAEESAPGELYSRIRGARRSLELREAFHALKGAVISRVRAGELDPARVAQIREIILRAARDIDAL